MDTLGKLKERTRILSKILHQIIAFKKVPLGFKLANHLWTETQESAALLVSPALVCLETRVSFLPFLHLCFHLNSLYLLLSVSI